MNILKRIMTLIENRIKYSRLKKMSPSQYKEFLETEYFNRTGEIPNLDEPEMYTEKMQYAKVHLNTSLKTKLSDKFAVRKWIEDKIGSEYLIPL